MPKAKVEIFKALVIMNLTRLRKLPPVSEKAHDMNTTSYLGVV